MRLRRAWPALVYLAVFVVLSLPWLRTSGDAVPAGNPFAFQDDARLWTWLLGWVAHALATDPARLLDAPIHHPAPAQLTGSEHLASTQLVAVPAVWLTGNPVLVANLIVFASYPLAAEAMRRLALALGCAAAAAWVAGLVFALGPLRVPANLEVIHFLNPYLPLAALALHRLRDAPGAGRALVLFAVLTAGALSGYYLAAMLAMVAVAWTALECARARPGLGRFLALAAAAGAGAAALLLVVSRPYFDRPELALAAPVGGLRVVGDAMAWPSILTLLRMLFGVVPGVLAVAGLAAVAVGGATARRLALAGLVVAAVGLVGVFPPAFLVDAVQASPLRFLRAQFRFGVVAGLGTALLAAAALEAVRARLGGRAGTVAAAVAALGVLGTLGPSFPGGRDRIAAVGVDAPVYDAVARATGEGGSGPLLELPLVDARWRQRGSRLPLGQLEAEAMVGSLRHGQPLVTGHTGYQPLHRPLLEQAIRALPQRWALDEIVDLTHVRWLLLRPADWWNDPRLRERVLGMPGVQRRLDRDGWTLARVDLRPTRPQWYAAVAAGHRPGHTVLGTPLAPIAEDAAVAEVVSPSPVVPRLDAGTTWMLPVEVRNRGGAAWPALVPPSAPRTHTVGLVARWTREGTAAPPQAIALRRDVAPGDGLVQTLSLALPGEPGTYALEVAPAQDGGAAFTAPGNAPLRLELAVVPRPAR